MANARSGPLTTPKSPNDGTLISKYQHKKVDFVEAHYRRQAHGGCLCLLKGNPKGFSIKNRFQRGLILSRRKLLSSFSPSEPSQHSSTSFFHFTHFHFTIILLLSPYTARFHVAVQYFLNYEIFSFMLLTFFPFRSLRCVYIVSRKPS